MDIVKNIISHPNIIGTNLRILVFLNLVSADSWNIHTNLCSQSKVPSIVIKLRTGWSGVQFPAGATD